MRSTAPLVLTSHAASQDDSPQCWRERVAHAFSRAAGQYQCLASAQQAMGEILWAALPERLGTHRAGNVNGQVLDLGCGPGHWSARLAGRYGTHARVTGLDLAPGMLEVAQRQHGDHIVWLCADAQALPLADASQDLVVSNLAIQWCPDLDAVLSEVYRVLRPGGRALINTLAPGTLSEVRHAWSRPGRPAAMLEFRSRERHLAAARLVGFSHVTVNARTQRFHYPDMRAVMASIKGVGAQTARPGAGLTRRDLARANHRYEALREPAGLPVSYRLLTLALTR